VAVVAAVVVVVVRGRQVAERKLRRCRPASVIRMPAVTISLSPGASMPALRQRPVLDRPARRALRAPAPGLLAVVSRFLVQAKSSQRAQARRLSRRALHRRTFESTGECFVAHPLL
jgi:hypothetical protein